ncbi:hypothetical protein [Ottowia testudinis]|uniref:Uncharacterized protein n=1 Tax=Ottowia testudinis TaxID=2816950 RepID=A0A975H5T5_9BURK|nr:hypothetical protein [Ottowia testudinis]QTD45287.1 hypothetical protein J1M35_20110 [Ottowia testudinis]
MDSKLKIVELALGYLTADERHQARMMLAANASVHTVCITLNDFRRTLAQIDDVVPA